MKIGYARVSTEDQKLDLQFDALNKAECSKIFSDHTSGAKLERNGLNNAIKYLRKGDSLVVWRLDRLSRSLKDLINTVSLLESKGVGLISLQESLNTNSSTGKLIFHIFGALAEFEKNIIKDRTIAGLKAARARGKKGGRPKALNGDDIKMLTKLYQDKEHSISHLCKLFKISKPTLYKYIQIIE